MERLGLKSSLEKTATVVEAWDPTCDGNLDLPSFSQFVADVRLARPPSP